MAAHPELAERSAISSLMSRFGAIDDNTIILSVKPSKKAPHKPPKYGTAVVEFKQIGDAFGAVCASSSKDRGMHNVEVTWVEGKEPPILGWLKRQGLLGSTASERKAQSPSPSAPASKTSEDLLASLNAKIAKSKSASSFASFPDSFVSIAIFFRRATYLIHTLSPPLQKHRSPKLRRQTWAGWTTSHLLLCV